MNSPLEEILVRIERRLEAIERNLSDRPDDVIEIDGAAAMTGLSKSAIYQKTCSRNGQAPELPHYKAGKRLYFRRSELVRWMTRRAVKDREAIAKEAAHHSERTARKRREGKQVD